MEIENIITDKLFISCVVDVNFIISKLDFLKYDPTNEFFPLEGGTIDATY